MKKNEKVMERLVRKQIAVANAIASILRRKKMNQKEFAASVPVRESFVSRIVSGYGTNVRLETIAKFETALGEDILVTPDEYEHKLVDNVDRLVVLIEASMKKDAAANIKIWETAQKCRTIAGPLRVEMPKITEMPLVIDPLAPTKPSKAYAHIISNDVKETEYEIGEVLYKKSNERIGRSGVLPSRGRRRILAPMFSGEVKSLLPTTRKAKVFSPEFLDKDAA